VFILEKVLIETMHYNLKYETSFAFTRSAEDPDFVNWHAWRLFLGVVEKPGIFPTMASSGVAGDYLASFFCAVG
jgi:hypothetical protein